jgi:hypothetical protein
MLCSTKVDMGQQESPSQNNNATTNPNVEILEQGATYFLYIPKKDAQEVKGVEN